MRRFAAALLALAWLLRASGMRGGDGVYWVFPAQHFDGPIQDAAYVFDHAFRKACADTYAAKLTSDQFQQLVSAMNAWRALRYHRCVNTAMLQFYAPNQYVADTLPTYAGHQCVVSILQDPPLPQLKRNLVRCRRPQFAHQ